jgi:excisionase family DNA binding protein
MKHNIFQVNEISLQEFQNQFKVISDQVESLKKIVEPKEKALYLSRKDVSKLLGISYPTLNEWSKKGILKAYRIGNRVLYKSNEVDESLTQINS